MYHCPTFACLKVRRLNFLLKAEYKKKYNVNHYIEFYAEIHKY